MLHHWLWWSWMTFFMTVRVSWNNTQNSCQLRLKKGDSFIISLKDYPEFAVRLSSSQRFGCQTHTNTGSLGLSSVLGHFLFITALFVALLSWIWSFFVSNFYHNFSWSGWFNVRTSKKHKTLRNPWFISCKAVLWWSRCWPALLGLLGMFTYASPKL